MINNLFHGEDDLGNFRAFLAREQAVDNAWSELMSYVQETLWSAIEYITENPMNKRTFIKVLDDAGHRIEQYINNHSLAKWPVSDADLGKAVSQFVKNKTLECWDTLEQEYLPPVQSVQARPSPIPAVLVSPSVNEVKLQIENQHLRQEIEKLRKERRNQLEVLQNDAPPPYCVDEAAVPECLLSGQHKVSQTGNSKDAKIIPKRSSSTGVRH